MCAAPLAAGSATSTALAAGVAAISAAGRAVGRDRQRLLAGDGGQRAAPRERVVAAERHFASSASHSKRGPVCTEVSFLR